MGAESFTSAMPTIGGVENLERVGRGGFATVYRGWQPRFHRAVAVKVLDEPSGATAGSQFAKEVRAMGAVSDHPHVVPVYDAGTVGDRHFLVMPWLPGGTLADDLRRGPMAPDEVVRIGRAIADALAAAHRAGLLHRDVKPGNILRTAYGQPQLADFGIARFNDATTTQGLILATVTYAAPEVLAGKPATPATDVYSLGATLHALLRGAPPYEPRDGEAPVGVAMRILSEPPADLRGTGVPPPLAAVIERAMARKPQQRYATADALREALDAIDLDVPPAVTGVRRRRRVAWPVIAAGAAVAVAALAAGALVARDDPSADVTETTVPGPLAAPTGDDLTAATRDYYAVMDGGRLDEGFALLTASYQHRAGGRESYDDFWRGIAAVEVVDATAAPEARQVEATLRYTRTDGSTSTESATITFVQDDDTGALLIDDYRLA